MMPASINLLPVNDLKMVIPKSPELQFWIVKANLPAISIKTAEQPSIFNPIPHPGNGLTYDNLRVEFMVDEGMYNYFELVDWMKGIAFPETFDQYDPDRRFIDISLFALDSNKNPKIEFVFDDAYPVSLSLPNQFSSQEPETEYHTALAEFKFLKWNYNRIRP